MADVSSLEKSIAKLEDSWPREKVDMGAIAAFNEADADWRKCASDFDEATAARDAVCARIYASSVSDIHVWVWCHYFKLKEIPR